MIEDQETDGFTKEFKPTPAMKLYAFQRAKRGDEATVVSISKEIGICQETICRWQHINGYTEWLEAQIAIYRNPISQQLEQVALDKIQDFKFWEALAIKYGYLRSEDAHTDASRLIVEFPGIVKNDSQTPDKAGS